MTASAISAGAYAQDFDSQRFCVWELLEINGNVDYPFTSLYLIYVSKLTDLAMVTKASHSGWH